MRDWPSMSPPTTPPPVLWWWLQPGQGTLERPRLPRCSPPRRAWRCCAERGVLPTGHRGSKQEKSVLEVWRCAPPDLSLCSISENSPSTLFVNKPRPDAIQHPRLFSLIPARVRLVPVKGTPGEMALYDVPVLPSGANL